MDSTDSWTYATDAWRSLNNNTNNRAGVVVGLNEEQVYCSHSGYAATANLYLGIGLDSVTADSNTIKSPSLAYWGHSQFNQYVGIGYHYLQLLERVPSGTATNYGDAGTPAYFQAGGLGYVWA